MDPPLYSACTPTHPAQVFLGHEGQEFVCKCNLVRLIPKWYILNFSERIVPSQIGSLAQLHFQEPS